MSYNGADGVFAGGNTSGDLWVSIRRSTLGHNALSGISAFSFGSGHPLVVADSTFMANTSGKITAQSGGLVQASGNLFHAGAINFNEVSGGVVETMQDNMGFQSGAGGATPQGKF